MNARISLMRRGVDGADPVSLLRDMVYVRQLEQAVLDLTRSDPPAIQGSVHLCAGQEAVPVGAAAALQDGDQIVCTYRGHGWAIAAGLSPLEVLGEICHRSVGVNGGRGGSAYMMAPARGFIGENSIVGAGVPIACGVALANELLQTGKVAVVTIGDGALNQGSVHEAFAFAAARTLPVLFICENNGWSEMTATREMFRVDRLSRRAEPYGFPGITIDGTDPIVVKDAIASAAERARRGEGPTLIECLAPRLWGHYNRDIEHYRSPTDKREANKRDPITTFAARLVTERSLAAEDLEAITQEATRDLQRVVAEVMASPEPDASTASEHVYAPLRPVHTSLKDTSDSTASAQQTTYIMALNEALRRELASRSNVIVYGEDVGKAGGIFGAARQLQRQFGAKRVFDTPIAESAILGSAIGASMTGLKPIVEIMWADFMLVALDQLVNQAANIRYITRGEASASIVVRTQQGVTPGSCAQHSQSLEALLLHVPGLRVAMPATPQDAYSILRAAVASSDPCIVIESRVLYQSAAPVTFSDEIESIGAACLRKAGSDALILTWGPMLPVAMEAAASLEQEGIAAAVLDLRWLSPLDEVAIMRAADAAGGRVAIVHEANVTGGFGAELEARLHRNLGRTKRLQIVRIGTPDVRMPAAPALQRTLVPSVVRVTREVHDLVRGTV